MRRYFPDVAFGIALLITLFLIPLQTKANPSPTPTPSPSPAAQPSSNQGFFTPGDVGHPVKLNFPFAWVGELKLPSRDEIASRAKLEFLGDLTEQQIRAELEKWPPYNSMSLGDQGKMLTRIQEFRDRRTKIAQDEAQKLGLNSLLPADQEAFKKIFWQSQLQIDDELVTNFQAQYDAKEQELDHELALKFKPLVPTPTVGPTKTPGKNPGAPKPPTPTKSPTPAPSPVLTPSPTPAKALTPTKSPAPVKPPAPSKSPAPAKSLAKSPTPKAITSPKSPTPTKTPTPTKSPTTKTSSAQVVPLIRTKWTAHSTQHKNLWKHQIAFSSPRHRRALHT